ncbi:Isochorismatase [Elstera litoralis]|uniref:Isochorismatase n=1 Tax=Elstera litoralis TaxID=552518 RepID=A0A0F3IRY1_9PROT|nr:cysteine hydrolase family protein [Elstera litoralis]KJV09471.1 Isochorismatase [Elstera litoralis]
MSQRALVIVDIQNDYFAGGQWPLAGQAEAAEKAAQILAAARAAGDAVIHIRHEITRPNAPFFVPGSEGAAIHSSVQPLPGETVIVKNFANSFRETPLKAELDGRGVTDLVILGSMSQNCIDSTTRAAADLGYGVTVIHDACATLDLTFGDQVIPAAQVQAAYMAALAFGFAKVVTAEAYLG